MRQKYIGHEKVMRETFEKREASKLFLIKQLVKRQVYGAA